MWECDQLSRVPSFSSESSMSQETLSPKQTGMVESICALFNLQDAQGISRLPVILPSSWVLVVEMAGSRLPPRPRARVPGGSGEPPPPRHLPQRLTQPKPPLGGQPGNMVDRHLWDTFGPGPFRLWFAIFKARLLELENPVLSHKA